MLSALAIYLNRREASRFESTRSKVKVRIVPTPDTGLDESVTVSLKRRDGTEIASQQVALNGDLPKGTFAEFDLAALVDGDGYPLVVRGDYVVEVSDDAANAEAVEADLRVALVTVEELRRNHCKGATLISSEVMRPRKQPRVITGVTVTDVSAETRTGMRNLIFTVGTPSTLQWGEDGATVELDESITSELLPDDLGNYIEVEIDHFELPSDDQTETLFIDQDRMTDEDLRSYVDQATEEVETHLGCLLEPQRVATEPYFSSPEEGEWVHRRGKTATYYRDAFNMASKAWHISLPYQHAHKIDLVEGFLGNAKALTILSGVFTVNEKQGTVNVMPFDSQYAHLWEFHIQMRLYGRRDVIEDFWRYKGIIGLEPEADILKAVGFIAAIPVLTVAGQAYRAGYSSESVSKDGVSSSKTYTSSATFGIYSATIGDYRKWLYGDGETGRNGAMKRLKAKYKGLMGVVL